MHLCKTFEFQFDDSLCSQLYKMDKQIDKYMDKQIDKQMDKQIDKQMYKQIDICYSGNRTLYETNTKYKYIWNLMRANF